MSLINRRRFLTSLGLGSGALLLSMLERSLIREAHAAPERPKQRLIIFTSGNGLAEDRYRGTVRSETDFDLPPIFAPLQPYKKDLLIVQKLHNPFNQELHGNGWATLSGRPSPRTAGDEDGPLFASPSGVSLDRFIGHTFEGTTPFPSINLGLLGEMGYVPHVSADGLGRAFPAEGSPVTAYQRLFGALLPTGGFTANQVLAQDRSLLDLVQGDIQRTMRRLAGSERAKLEQYLESVRALEARLQRLDSVRAACSGFAAPDPKLHDLQGVHGPVRAEVLQSHIDVAFNALSCGLSRVATISLFSNDASHLAYNFLGDMLGHHQQCHALNEEMLQKIDAFIASQLAYLVGRLRAVPEGDGTMADNTLIMWMNSGGGKHHNGWNNHAAVLIGKAGGYFRTGRYLNFPSGERFVGDLFTSVANAMGLPVQSFGDEKSCKGPLPNLT